MPKLTIKSKLFIALLLLSFSVCKLHAQQLKITDFVLFGGQNKSYHNNCTNPALPGYSVYIGSFANITNGRIGSYNLIKSTGSNILSSTLNSGGTIDLANNNKVSGSITAQNQYKTYWQYS